MFCYLSFVNSEFTILEIISVRVASAVICFICAFIITTWFYGVVYVYIIFSTHPWVFVWGGFILLTMLSPITFSVLN